MDLRNLKYFIAVYEQQSFSAAAKTCFVAQPSISAAIATLEQSLNSRLFIRHARGVKATNKGQQLYPLAKKMLGQADAIKSVFNETSHNHPFNLGVTRGLGVERMSLLLKDFTSAQDKMELTLVPQSEPCDARIIIKEELNEDDHYIALWQEEYLAALPFDHVLTLKDKLELSDFDGLPFIQRTPCTAWDTLNDTLTLAGYTLDVRAKIQTIDYAIGLVHADLGCALVPAHPEIINKQAVVFKAINGLTLRREIVLAYQQTSAIIENLKQLINRHKQ